MENLQQQLDAAYEKNGKLFEQVQYWEHEWLVHLRLSYNEQYSEEHKERLRNRAQMDIDMAEIKREKMRRVQEEIIQLKLDLMHKEA